MVFWAATATRRVTRLVGFASGVEMASDSTSSAIRPQTAPRKRPMTAQQSRPLGRVAAPLRQQVAEHGSNPESIIAAIKGDLLTVQRRIDGLRGLDRTSPDMEFLERHLLMMNATTGDDSATTDTINTLLEMLVHRFGVLSAAALQSCGEDVSQLLPGRAGSILALTNFVGGLAHRKKLWDAAAPTLRDASSQPDAGAPAADGPPRPARGAFDDAMNEPTVSQLRRLIQDQRALQSQLQVSLDATNFAAVKAREEALRMSHSADHAKRQADAALAEMTKQRDALQRRVTDLQLEVKRLADDAKHGHQPHAEGSEAEMSEAALVQRAAGELAFARVRPSTLNEVGFDSKLLTMPSAVEADSIAARVSAIISEVAQASSTEPHTKHKAKSHKSHSADSSGHTEGVLWWILSAQSALVESLDSRLGELQRTAQTEKSTADAELARLNRVISALNERVNVIKSNAMRDAERAKLALSVQSVHSRAASATDHPRSTPPPSRILRVKGESVSAEDRERALEGQLLHQRHCIDELREQLAAARQATDDERRDASTVRRESALLLSRATDERNRTSQAHHAAHALESEIQSLRNAHQVTKKELREKSALEAELQQAKWKLEVELHIAQNVISELRNREEQLTVERRDASDCHDLIQRTLSQERVAHAAEIAALGAQLREAKAAEDVARNVLRSERAKMLEHEREVDRLRSLDLQMDVLEQNFTNYAACKLAQREAVEEEEKVLQSCVDNIGRDVFVLPASNDSEERIQLYLEKLRAAKDTFDAEERSRKRQKATTVNWKDDRSGRKQLAYTMQQRYNAIQIFACEQRLRQMQIERASSRLQVEADEYRTRNEALLAELAHAKAQCDGLVQRNTELELQRKEFVRGRVVAEQEIKSLKSTVHKMRISNEEQEKVLIDVGTRLQQAKTNDGSLAIH
jgi:hypothetical protein